MVEKMGFGWDEVHEIAEQVEHIKSSIFFEKMDELLSFPKTDPHGSPIPDKEGKVHWVSYEKLSDIQPGATVVLSAVVNTTSEFLRFLNSKGLSLGMKINVLAVEPFDKSYTIAYVGRNQESLSLMACERLLLKLG